jgi:hypothetical protein
MSENISKTAERLRRYRREHPEKNREKNNKWKKNNRDKYLAHKAVEYALVTGRLVKEPCCRCGCDQAHAHHDDYSKPLEVMWLCREHHIERHQELELNGGLKPG